MLTRTCEVWNFDSAPSAAQSFNSTVYVKVMNAFKARSARVLILNQQTVYNLYETLFWNRFLWSTTG